MLKAADRPQRSSLVRRLANAARERDIEIDTMMLVSASFFFFSRRVLPRECRNCDLAAVGKRARAIPRPIPSHPR